MGKEKKEVIIPEEVLMSKIYLIRGQKVMLDADLAELYEVATKRLNEQVKRNRERFPEDFMFQLSLEEFKNLKSQNATAGWGGRRKAPYAFTEHGVLMLSSVLRSQKAIEVNIHIMRIFTKMRTMLLSHKEMLLKLEKIEKTISNHDEDIDVLFKYIKELVTEKESKKKQAERKQIGFNREDEKE